MTSRTSNQPTGADKWGAPLFLGGVAGLLAAAGFYLGGWGLVWQSQGKGFQVEPAMHHLLPGRQGGDRPHAKAVAFMQAEYPVILKALEVGPQIAGLLVGGLVFWMTLGDVAVATRDRHVRGRRRLQGEAARKAWVKAEGENADGLHIHPCLPSITKSRETRHILIFGGVGSGKTQTLLPLMRAARARGDRMLIFDNKGDFTPDFPSRRMPYNGQEVEVEDVIFAPWDSRAVPWAVAKDVSTLSAAREFAARMIVEPAGSGNPMWVNASRQVLVTCLVELQSTRPGDWGFSNLVAGLTRPVDQLTEVAKRYFPEAVKALGDGGQRNVTTDGIQINLMSYLSLIFDLARAWPKPGIFSIRDWLSEKNKSTKSVILQHTDEFKSLARAFNSAILELASQLINSPLIQESNTRRLWFFLDEFPQLGKVEAVFPLCEIGRSKGIRVVIGMQDIAQSKKIYGAELTEALLSMVGTHVVTRVSAGETANYITEKLVGEREVERLDVSTSSGTGRSPGIFTAGGTRTNSWKTVREPVMMPSEILQLGPVPGQGVKVLVLGVGEDALEVLVPFTNPNHFRPASVIADWTRYPSQPIAPAVATLEQEAAEAEAAVATPLLVTPTSPAVTPAVNPWADDIDGDEVGEDEESAPAPVATTASDPLAFLDDGESTEKTPAAEFETRMLPIATPLTSQLADQAKEEAAESVGGELAQHVGIAALPSGIAEIAHAVEIADTLLDLAGAAMPATDVLPVTEAGAQPPKKKKFRLKKSATAQLEESI